jgi:hypothetical protein
VIGQAEVVADVASVDGLSAIAAVGSATWQRQVSTPFPSFSGGFSLSIVNGRCRGNRMLVDDPSRSMGGTGFA